MKIKNIVENYACKILPESYIVHLSMENGAAWISLEYPNGDISHVYADDRGLEYHIIEAVKLAQKHSKDSKKPYETNIN
ncbi:hypothetical protein M0R04_04625 [Candidatus Dojkabacteria bacterium]|jgi:hypothetical protein|nr:hypothetical protein [Candidatus Dojkabacteria bacterium]